MTNSSTLSTKAMRLPEIFGLSTFPVFRQSKLDQNKTGVLNLRKFRETYQKFSRNSSSKPLSENIPEFSKIPKIPV